jgi:hypothetical protein
MELREALGSTRGKIAITLFIATLVFLGFAIYTTFYQGEQCANYSCFQKNMAACTKASYISEQPEASWGYNLVGLNGGNCVVNVKLLQAKKGTLDITGLRGYSMDCSYPNGIATYPEKNLDNCHGRLKEELQGVLINKLYAHILQNLGQISEGLKSAV